MIKLNQNTVNNVILTLSESVTYTGSPVYFLFRFVNQTTKEEKLFTTTDLSTNIVRYNQFNITLTGSTSENLTGGTINLPINGEYDYYIYQQSTPTNLSLNNVVGGTIEKGLVKVVGTSLNVITQTYDDADNTFIGYQP